MTELKCNNCRESFVATREYSIVHAQDALVNEIARFCPYCGSTSLSVVVRETRTVADKIRHITENPREPLDGVSIEPEDLVEEEEKPRRQSER